MPAPRLYRPDDDRPRPFVTAEPVPVQMRRSVVETTSGTFTDFLIVWRVGATRCRFCPAHECTFLAAGDVGSCVVRKPGDLSSPFAAVS